MPRARAIALLLVLTSAAALAVSVLAMARRVAAFYAGAGHTLYVFRPVLEREFTYAGRAVRLSDEGGEDAPAVVVRYGDRVLRLPATRPPGSPQLPGLTRHEEWLRVLRFAERGRMSEAELERRIESGEVADRLVILTLDPRRWADGRPFGQGQAKDWLFGLYELLPDGGIREERFTFPRGRRASEPPPPGPPPLVEGSWQYYAALSIIPQGSKPTPRFTADAVRAMGWTLPAAAFSGLVLTLALPALFAPRTRGWRAPAATEERVGRGG